MTAALPIDRLAQVERLAAGGFVLVPVPERTKGPTLTGWNTDPAQWIQTPSAAREYHRVHPGAGVGLLHSESGTCALDVDSEQWAPVALAAVGVDLAAMVAANPYRVRGKRGEKPIYRVPDGLSLKPHKLIWPDPGGKKGPGGRVAGITLLELRAGPVQDVLPPSIHPEGMAYEWVGPVPGKVSDLPELPAELLGLWQRWGTLEPVLRGACPWAPQQSPLPSAERVRSPAGGGESVVSAFNGARTVGEVLNLSGYIGPPRGPWLYLGSESGHAGVRLLPGRTPAGHEAVYSHHAADPLGDGVPRDAFGLWALLEHGVNLGSAEGEAVRGVVKLAARFLGLPEPPRPADGPSAPGQVHAPARDLPTVTWGEVSPLPPVTEPVPSLPAEMLPEPLAAWIQDEARAAGLPLEMVAVPVLIGAGGMIGTRLTLRNARNTPAVPPNLWGAVCGPPSIKKTHAVNLGAAPLNRAQRREFERLDAERGELETVRERAAAQLDALQSRMKQALKGGKSAPPLPSDDELTAAHSTLSEADAALKPVRYVVNDPTVEKLGEILQGNPQGVTLVRDELTAWLASFERAGREGDRGFYLEAANGTGSFTVDRLARGTLYLPLLCVGVLGSIQPGPLSEIMEAQRGAGDGLLQRFQGFIWPDTFPPFDQHAQREPVSEAQRSAAVEVLDALSALTLSGLGSTHPSGDGAPLTYCPEAQMIYDAWEIEHAAQVRDLSRGEAYRAHLGKQPGTFARLALIFHALDVAALGVGKHPHPAQVGQQAAALAADWCEYLSTHARKLWGEGRRFDVLDAREVLRFIERGRIQDGMKVGDVRRTLAESKAALTGERLGAALRVLEACGALRVHTAEVGPKGGRPIQTVRLHPDALTALDGKGA